jgi:hypothetical protein
MGPEQLVMDKERGLDFKWQNDTKEINKYILCY